MTGESFAPFLQDAGTSRDEVYLAYSDSIRGLIQGDWKLLEYRGADGYAATQLFHITEDPLEMIDRAPDPRYRDRIAAMRIRLQEQRKFYGDTDNELSVRYWQDWDAVAT